MAGFILEASGGFHWKAYSSVDIRTGEPLAGLRKDGQPLRKQQSILLARKNDTYTSKSCWQVQELAARQAKQIDQWEKAATVSPTDPLTDAPDQDMTIATFYQSIFIPWLESQVKTGQKANSTLVSYKRYWDTYLADHFDGTKTFKNYRPYVGAQFLQDLRREDGTPFGENTVKHLHSVASGLFTRAVELDYVAHNPWHDIKVGSVPSINAEQGEAFAEKDVETMIANLDCDREALGDWKIGMAQCVLAVGIWAGLRPSEIAALQWEAIDLNDSTLTVRKAYVYGRETTQTKTRKERIVPFRDKLAPILKSWWITNGRPKSGWVFQNRDGNPVDMPWLSHKIIRPNCEKHRVVWKDSAFYALRRGCGSLLVQDGWSCEEVAQFLGNTRDVVYKYYFVDAACELASKARERSRRKENA